MSSLPPCIHNGGKGLCRECRADYAEDPEAWMEFGNHREGIERWRKLREEIISSRPHGLPFVDSRGDTEEIPF